MREEYHQLTKEKKPEIHGFPKTRVAIHSNISWREACEGAKRISFVKSISAAPHRFCCLLHRHRAGSQADRARRVARAWYRLPAPTRSTCIAQACEESVARAGLPGALCCLQRHALCKAAGVDHLLSRWHRSPHRLRCRHQENHQRLFVMAQRICLPENLPGLAHKITRATTEERSPRRHPHIV